MPSSWVESVEFVLFFGGSVYAQSMSEHSFGIVFQGKEVGIPELEGDGAGKENAHFPGGIFGAHLFSEFAAFPEIPKGLREELQ